MHSSLGNKNETPSQKKKKKKKKEKRGSIFKPIHMVVAGLGLLPHELLHRATLQDVSCSPSGLVIQEGTQNTQDESCSLLSSNLKSDNPSILSYSIH